VDSTGRGRAAVRILKKYPNRRLYDTEKSEYVTLDDVRKMILGNDPIKVLDSKTGKDLTRSVLLQIIAEQEAEGHEPLLTNRVLEQVVRFYGDSMQSVLSRYLEQSIMTFLEQQELYQRRMRDVLNASPLKLMQRLADQNINFLRSLLPGTTPASGDADTAKVPDTAVEPEQEPPPEASDGASELKLR
jgi:polyhydroxyalkanoate synthesis repressor PhaR